MKHARHSTVDPLERAERRIAKRSALFDGFDLTLVVLQTVSILLVIFSAIPFTLQLFTGSQLNIVLTGSMSGTAAPGDLIQTQPYLGQQLTKGTIIGVEQNGIRYTHRIVEVTADDDGEVTYRTKGDANDNRDLFKPSSEDIWGVATNIIQQPMAGFLTRFAWNAEWSESFMAAIIAKDFTAAGALMPNAPWGLLILLGAIILFWWILPDVLQALRARLDRRDHAVIEQLAQADTELNAEVVASSPFEQYRKTA